MKFEEIEFPKARMSQFFFSETTPQQHRRKHYIQHNIAELSLSIAEYGVLDPLKVRLVKGKLEIVDGERRFRAAQIAGLKEIPYALHKYTDKQLLLIQLHSNLNRENPRPLDEAYNYGVMRDELGMTNEQIAAEVGKEVGFVEKRLKLLLLSESIREAYDKGEISLSHAQEIAIYPEADHEEIFSYCFSNFGHTSQALYPFAKAKSQIAQHYLLQLSKAQFRLDDPTLRSDGRTCLECHERTGAHPLLFDESGVGEKDSCFNRDCYNGKVEKFVQIKRVSIATNVLNFPKDAAQDVPVPVVMTRLSEVVSNVPTINIDDVLVVESLDSCAYVKVGVGGDGEHIGKEIYYCNKPDFCKVHRPDASKEVEPSAEDESAKMYQKEEDFQVLVGEAVRREVLKVIANKIKKGDFYFMIQNFIEDLIEKLFSTATPSELDVVHFGLDSRTRLTTTENLNDDQKEKLLFLLLYSGTGQMTNVYVSQARIKDLADDVVHDYGVDYQMIDAVKRLELAPEHHRKTFYAYLRNIEDDKREAEIPQVYSQEWERKD